MVSTLKAIHSNICPVINKICPHYIYQTNRSTQSILEKCTHAQNISGIITTKACPQTTSKLCNSQSKPSPKVWSTRDPLCPMDAIYIGRGSKYGNPFIMNANINRNKSCDLYEAMVEADATMKQEFIEELRGHDLRCFCAPLRCHGDYLLSISNK